MEQLEEDKIGCARCGKVIYRAASKEGLCRRCRGSIETPLTTVEVETKASLSSERDQKQFKFNKPNLFASALLALVAATSISYFGYQFWYENHTEEGRLRSTVKEYLSLSNQDEIVESFEYLTPLSKKMTLEKWVEDRQSARNSQDEISGIVLLSDDRAKVALQTEGLGLYSTTWIKVDNNWRRAFYEDNKEKLDRKLKINLSIEGLSGAPEFTLQDVILVWSTSKSNLSRQLLYRPELKFSVHNTSKSKAIDHLEFKAQFINSTTMSIFSEVSEYAIGSSDLPLKPGMTSQVFFMTSSIGFDITESIVQNPDALAQKMLSKRSEIMPQLYYRTSRRGEWLDYQLQF